MALFGSKEAISVVAQVHAKSGREDEVRTALESVAGPSRKELGCLKYDLFEDKHYTGSFFTYEEWESEGALEQHLSSNKVELKKLKALLREEMRLNVLKPIA